MVCTAICNHLVRKKYTDYKYTQVFMSKYTQVFVSKVA